MYRQKPQRRRHCHRIICLVGVCLAHRGRAVQEYLRVHLPFIGVVVFAYLGEDIPKCILCICHFVSMRWLKPVTPEGQDGLRKYREQK